MPSAVTSNAMRHRNHQALLLPNGPRLRRAIFTTRDSPRRVLEFASVFYARPAEKSRSRQPGTTYDGQKLSSHSLRHTYASCS